MRTLLNRFRMMEGRTGAIVRRLTKGEGQDHGGEQDLRLYFEDEFADALDTWANDTCWPEISMLLDRRIGTVLDLACGTGRAADFIVSNEAKLTYFGCDISEKLIGRAVKRGIPQERLLVGNAASLDYPDKKFDFLFSIGSLEHFSTDVLDDALRECKRVCWGINFHMLPVSRYDVDEGWFAPNQAYWNNSEDWWVRKFESVFGAGHIWTMNSSWSDGWSRGLWFICRST